VKTGNKKILVADDDPLMRKLLSAVLTFYGYDIECVSNGKEAIALVETGSYDILITDYLMPEMNGIDLIKKARDIKKSLTIIGMRGKSFYSQAFQPFCAKK
jgi:CheY-like chemotaxis protein